MEKDKKIVVMQPYFLPYYGYFQLIKSADIFVVFDDVNYINRGWINRNRILVNGADDFITIPLSKASQNKLIKDIEISQDGEVFKKKMLEKIRHAYKKAKYFSDVFPIIEKIFLFQEKDLTIYLINSLYEICKYLEMPFNYVLSSSIKQDEYNKGQYKIMEICRHLGGKYYINPSGGREMYDAQEFSKNNLELRFCIPSPAIYKQFDNEFVPNLSIVDLLMFNSKSQANDFINSYNLIK